MTYWRVFGRLPSLAYGILSHTRARRALDYGILVRTEANNVQGYLHLPTTRLLGGTPDSLCLTHSLAWARESCDGQRDLNPFVFAVATMPSPCDSSQVSITLKPRFGFGLSPSADQHPTGYSLTWLLTPIQVLYDGTDMRSRSESLDWHILTNVKVLSCIVMGNHEDRS
ncbi:hypothetical protein VNO77_21771 [Canavalia gladiata]|uniref:Uncharacterized protein n=1 Tax=Canavalia gladiata TaxID=3824 RepID=A0AAN9L4U5_CANGL